MNADLQAVLNLRQTTGMRVPVYFTELGIGIRMALFGEDDPLLRAQVRQNRRLSLNDVKGAIEQPGDYQGPPNVIRLRRKQ